MVAPKKSKSVNPKIKFQIQEFLYDGDQVQNNKSEPQEDLLYSEY